MAMTAVDADETRVGPARSPESGDEEARAFLQERLAYLGRAYALIGIGFFSRRNAYSVVVPAACAMYLVQWAVCRRRPLRLSTLRVIDGTTSILTAGFNAATMLSAVPGELPGLSYARALLLFTFGLAIRAIVVPSSARRTAILGVAASSAPVAVSHLWYTAQTLSTLSAGMHAVWTTLWCLGTVVIATLASHVIFGLRRQVREAWQLGQYTLLEKIGQGGMGAVYRASHAMLRRPTAVKLLPADKTGAEHLERFEREVQLTSRLTHSNTVAIFDYGRTPDGVFYYAMEYLEGLNLQELVAIDGPQVPARVIHILRQVASSLAEAHGIGLIHRDIKPANVILVEERGGSIDVVKVVDFGLVKELEKKADITRDDQIAGTPHYFAPEMISSPDQVSPSSDLYSLGCVGYYLLTGKTVFEGRTVVEVYSHHLRSVPESPEQRVGRAVPATLSAIVMSCLEKTPSARPRSAQHVVELLDACHDVELWTNEMGRSWWASRGRSGLAQLRQQRKATEPQVHSTDMTVVRPAEASRRA